MYLFKRDVVEANKAMEDAGFIVHDLKQ